MMDDSDTALMLAACGDAPARFGQVFERHHGAVWAYLARLCGPEAADELAGEVFVAAFARRHRYDPAKGELRPWLFGIATNLARGRARSAGRAGRALQRLRWRAPVDVPVLELVDDAAELGHRAQQLRWAIARLRPEERELLVLYAWEELDYAGIARALGIPVGTVRSRISRLRARLREMAADGGGPPEPEPIRARRITASGETL